jgi:hypothetical protein
MVTNRVDGFESQSGKKSRRWWMLAAAIVTLLVVFTVVIVLVGGGDGESDGPLEPGDKDTSKSDAQRYEYVPDLCEQLDWSAIEEFASLSKFVSPEPGSGEVSRCGADFDDGEGNQSAIGYDVFLEVFPRSAVDDAVAGYESLQKTYPVPTKAGDRDKFEGWQQSYRWEGAGHDGKAPRCVFFGQDDNLTVVLSVELDYHGEFEVGSSAESVLSDAVTAMADQAQKLTAV